MASIFTKIVKGEIPCYKVAETANCLAFLDVSPLAKGHTLVIPKKEIDLIFDVEEDLYQEMWALSKKVAKELKKQIPCARVGVAVIGLEVPHAHIHLVPMNEIGDLNFTKKRLELSKEEFETLAQNLFLKLN